MERLEEEGKEEGVIYTQQCILFFHWNNTIVKKISVFLAVQRPALSGQISVMEIIFRFCAVHSLSPGTCSLYYQQPDVLESQDVQDAVHWEKIAFCSSLFEIGSQRQGLRSYASNIIAFSFQCGFLCFALCEC